jgi:hypothetical protein
MKTRRHLELLMIPGVPLPPRMVVLYGYLRRDADNDRKIQATHAALAAKIGLRTTRQVCRLLCQLRELRLVVWRRGGDLNTYWVREPDVNWITAYVEKSRQ